MDRDPFDIPRIIATLRPDGVDGYVVRCPYCGLEHAHGLGRGHRIPHCRRPVPGWERGYLIVGVAKS